MAKRIGYINSKDRKRTNEVAKKMGNMRPNYRKKFAAYNIMQIVLREKKVHI